MTTLFSARVLQGAALGILLGGSASAHAQLADVGESVAGILKDEGLMGAAWVLVDGDRVRTGSAGLRDGDSGESFAGDTRFHVGSVTKSVLATGVLRLATLGELDLDAPVTTYLPSLTFDNPWPATPVTVRHLMDHTAGIDDARLWQMFSERAAPDAALAAAFPDPGSLLRVRAKPGTRFSYSNMGYTLLGMVIEAVTGARYEQVLDERLLQPLGMVDSTFAFTTQAGAAADPRLAWGHVDDGSRYAAQPIFLRPAGQFTTTTQDLGRYLRFLMSDGTVGDTPFIRPEWMALRGKPTTTDAAQAGLAAGYALGLGRRDRHGVVGFCHGGNIVGFSAMACVFPDHDRAFAYSVNTDSETASYGRIDAALIKALGIPAAAAPTLDEPRTDWDPWLGHYVLSPNRFAMFEYLDTVFGAVELRVHGEALEMHTLQARTRVLRPVGGRLLSADDRTTASHALLVDGETRSISDGFKTYEQVTAPSRLAHWVSLALGGAGLAWFLVAACMGALRSRAQGVRRPEILAGLAVVALALPIPLFVLQSFMALGDRTLASMALAAMTILLPLAMVITLLRSMRDRARLMNRFNAVAAVLVLQWNAVVAWYGMLPLRLWA